MQRLRTTFGRIVLLTGLAVWALSLTAAELHTVFVAHVVCAEHGDVVEVDLHGDVVAVADVHDGPQLVSADKSEHDHGCATELISLAALSFDVALPPLPKAPPVPQTLRKGDATPRGPPLDYAPKTGPPLLA